MKKVMFLFMCICCMLTLSAQIRGSEIRVHVSPDHPDWQYTLNEPCTFTIQVLQAQHPLDEVVVDYELGAEMYPDQIGKNVKLKQGKLVLTGTMKNPGFLRCKVRAYINGREYEGLATAGYEAHRLQPVTRLPDDFHAYWSEILDSVRRTPLDPRLTLLSERCTSTDNVYHVNFQTDAAGSRFYGILTVPKAEGKYPALLRVPGAGIRPYEGDTYTAPGKIITLEVGIHGIPVTMERPFYDNLMNGALRNYWTYCTENQNTFYYNRVITGVLRSVDFICELPAFNGKTLGVTGSSQGGALSVITAALDPRVTFLAAIHPALCDHEGFLEKRAGGWPHYLYYASQPDKNVLRTLRYYDTANFARFIGVPGWYSWGYNDEVCAPTSMYAAYNVINAPKELHLYLETGHYWYQEQWEEWQAWLRNQLQI